MDEPSVTWRTYALVAAGSLGYTCLMFTWFTLPAYLPIVIEDVGLTGSQAGLLAGAVPLTYIPLALFSGLAVDRIGPGRSLAAGILVFGTAQMARSFAPGFPSLLVTTLLLGVGATAITFGLPKLVSVLFPPERTGFPSSIYMVGSSAGTAAAFGLGRPVIGPWLGGWRPLFLYSGAVTVAYAVVWLAIVHVSSLSGQSADDGHTLTPGSVGRDIRAVLTHRELRLVVVAGVTYLLIIHGLQGWLPTVLESRGLSPERAGQTTTVLVVANVVGILVVPGLADRTGARRIAIAACGFIAGCGVLAIIAGGATLLAAVGVVAAGFGVGGLAPLVRAIPPELDGIGPKLTGAAVGLVFAVGEIGGFLGPVLIGALFDLTGSYAPGLGVLVAGGAVAILAGIRLRNAERTRGAGVRPDAGD